MAQLRPPGLITASNSTVWIGVLSPDIGHLEKVRDWFGRPLWEMEPPDGDSYFGKVVRDASPSLRAGRAGALSVFFDYLELRHRAELHQLTGRLVECPLDEMNRPRATITSQLRIPPSREEVNQLFAGWRADLADCRKFAPAARNYAVARLSADVGLRINEARMLDLDDVRWDLGRFGKVNVRFGKGSRRSGPKQRIVPLINGADRSLRWYVEDVWGLFVGDHLLPGSLCSLRSAGRAQAGSATRSSAPHSPTRPPATCRPGPGSSPPSPTALLRLPALPHRHGSSRPPGAAGA